MNVISMLTIKKGLLAGTVWWRACATGPMGALSATGNPAETDEQGTMTGDAWSTEPSWSSVDPSSSTVSSVALCSVVDAV